MQKIDYKKLMEQNPTLLDTLFKNQLDQEVKFFEHPTKGDESPVIAVINEVAVLTDFYDTSDFYHNSDYNPVLVENEIKCFYEIS